MRILPADTCRRNNVLRQFVSCGIAAALLSSCSEPTQAPVFRMSSTPSAPTGYVIHDLGTLGSPGPFGGPPISAASAINGNGQVVGESDTQDQHHPFLWDNGSMLDLGTLGGTFASASDINDLVQIVGTSTTADGHAHAFIWQKGTMQDLGTLSGGYSQATKINSVGQVLGISDGEWVLWNQGAIVRLGLVASAINDRGKVAGTVNSGSAVHGAIWEAGVITDLGTLGGASSWATFISNNGLVVGRSQTAAGATHAFLWAKKQMIDLGALPGDDESNAQFVSENGAVAGLSINTQMRTTRSFLWQNGVITDLGSFGGSLGTLVTGLNNQGTLSGVSYTPNFKRRPYAWRDGTLSDLGTVYANGNAGAAGLNQAGWVVGQTEVRQDVYHAVAWEPVR